MTCKRLLLYTIAATLLVSVTGTVRAEPHAGVDAQLFRPAFDPNGIYSIEGASVMPEHDFSMKMGFGYGQSPFNVAVPGISDEVGDDRPVLNFAFGMHITTSFAFTESLSIGIDTGLYRTNPDDAYGQRATYRPNSERSASTGLIALRPISNIDPAGDLQHEGRVGPYDVRLGAKYLLSSSESLNLAILGIAHVPFGDEEMFLGDQSFVFEPRLAADWKLTPSGSTRVSLNAGTRFRERTVLESYDATLDGDYTPEMARPVYDLGSEAVVGAGLHVELLPQLSLGAESVWFLPLPEAASLGECELHDGTDCSDIGDEVDYFGDAGYGDPAGYAIGGLDYRITPDVALSVAGGAGLAGARAEDFRLVTAVTWAPTPAGTRVIGRGDRDGDGIPDASDICPDEPEDKDGYQDDDGCPELDNDGDGIIDASDSCPNEPEDKDGYQDEDGCPDRDNDGDGIPDVIDRCPDEPEDIDGFDDDDGCPDEDNDGDGFPDDIDQCPNQPETVNGVDDEDGCPDSAVVGGPRLQADRIDLQGSKIDFAGDLSADLTKGDRALLDQIARILQADGNQNVVIRVEAHVPRGTARTPRGDRRLTRARAEAVVSYLVGKGVPQPRVQGVGLGSTVPLAEDRPGADINERVDFIRVR